MLCDFHPISRQKNASRRRAISRQEKMAFTSYRRQLPTKYNGAGYEAVL